jgi:hypothetical protein
LSRRGLHYLALRTVRLNWALTSKEPANNGWLYPEILEYLNSWLLEF